MEKPKVARTIVICSICKLGFKSRQPKGGDGSGWFPAFHKHDGKRCEGSWTEGIPEYYLPPAPKEQHP